MTKSMLFLLCPECNLELEIKKHFTGKLYLLTALGAVFDVTDQNYTGSIENIIEKKNISEIIIVNDPSCRLIQSVLISHKPHQTNTEEILQILYSNYQIELLTEKSLLKRAVKLCRLNIKLQAELLKENDLIGNIIEKNKIKLKGMIYERESDLFSEITL